MASPTPQMQRNGLAPGLLAAIALFLSPLFAGDNVVATIIIYLDPILSLIVAWFAWQARQWWWIIVFVAIAVIWNPVFPFGFSGQAWTAAQFVAALLFIAAGVLIKTERAPV